MTVTSTSRPIRAIKKIRVTFCSIFWDRGFLRMASMPKKSRRPPSKAGMGKRLNKIKRAYENMKENAKSYRPLSSQQKKDLKKLEKVGKWYRQASEMKNHDRAVEKYTDAIILGKKVSFPSPELAKSYLGLATEYQDKKRGNPSVFKRRDGFSQKLGGDEATNPGPCIKSCQDKRVEHDHPKKSTDD